MEAERQKQNQCLVIQGPGDKAVTSGLTEGNILKAGAQEMYFLCHQIDILILMVICFQEVFFHPTSVSLALGRFISPAPDSNMTPYSINY